MSLLWGMIEACKGVKLSSPYVQRACTHLSCYLGAFGSATGFDRRTLNLNLNGMVFWILEQYFDCWDIMCMLYRKMSKGKTKKDNRHERC